MEVKNYIAYKVIPSKYILDKKQYQKGKMFPNINRTLIHMEDQANRFEQIRLESFPDLPSRDNLFVFNNKEFAPKWAAKLSGSSMNYIIVELSLTGDLTWFDCNYWDLDQPYNYWKSASPEPSEDPLCEGVFCGTAIIMNVVLVR